MTTAEADVIRSTWAETRKNYPHLRARDIAQSLHISEVQLVASRCGDGVTRLQGPWSQWLKALPQLGRVMALTRNESAVHEKYGTYQNIKVFGNMGLVLDEDIDLRIFFNHWHTGFAVTEETRSGIRHSLQFFDIDGTMVHKVYLTTDDQYDTWQQLVKQFVHPNQSIHQQVTPLPKPAPEQLDSSIDIDSFRTHWLALQDTHDFFDLLKTFGVTRTQGLRLAGSDLAYPVITESLRLTLFNAAAMALPIMIFVGSRGVIQIHTGVINTLKAVNEWYNVLDDNFNLHLREDHIDSAWVVKKPTVDGIVTSLELFDANGDTIAFLFGKRKPGQAEDGQWRELVATLPRATY